MTISELEALLQTAEEENEHGNCVNAEKLAREVIQNLSENEISGNDPLHIRALIAISESLRRRGLAKEALAIAEEAHSLLTNAIGPGIKKLSTQALSSIGSACRDLSEYSRSLEYYEKSLALSEEIGYKQGVAAGVGNIGSVYKNLSQYPKALDYYAKALALFEELGDKGRVAIITGSIGSVYWFLAQHAKALDYYEKALALDEELGNKADMVTNCNGIGNMYLRLSQYAKALENYEKALALSEELGLKGNVAGIVGNMGIVYFELSEFERAIEYFVKALAIHQELGNKQGAAINTGNIGNAYLELCQYTNALECYEKALELCEKIGARRPAAYWLHGKGYTLHKLGRHKEGKEYLERALQLRRDEIGTEEDVDQTLLALGMLLHEENRVDEAAEKLNEALALSQKLGIKGTASGAHEELAKIYEKIGDTAKAFDHTKKHYALKEEILSDDTRKRVEAFNIRVAIAGKERDAALARQEAEFQRLRAEQSEKELSNSTLQLLAQAELLSNLRNDLLQIARKIPAQEPAARELRERVKNLPCESINWEKFEKEFISVHPEFRKTLREKFPDLTPQELRLCQLLRTGLESHEAARLMCITERGVETHRLRIRRKLGIRGSASLAEFLQKL